MVDVFLSKFDAMAAEVASFHWKLRDEYLRVVQELDEAQRQLRCHRMDSQDAAPEHPRCTQLEVADGACGEAEMPARPLAVLVEEAVHGACASDGADQAFVNDIDSESAMTVTKIESGDDGGGEQDHADASSAFLNVFPKAALPAQACPLKSLTEGEKIIRRLSLNRWAPAGTNSESLAGKSDRQIVEDRIMARLGLQSEDVVTPATLLSAVERFGISVFSESALRNLIKKLNVARARRAAHNSLERLGSRVWHSGNGAVLMLSGRTSRVVAEPGELALVSQRGSKGQRRSLTMRRGDTNSNLMNRYSRFTGFWSAEKAEISVGELLECFFDPIIELYMHHVDIGTLNTIAEILASGNVNVVVSQLASVELDDLAAPAPRPSVLEVIEPFVAALILANGILLGFQTDSKMEGWAGWMVIEVSFVIIFTIELFLRVFVLGPWRFLTGFDNAWNMLDTGTVVMAWIEIVLQQTWNGQVLRLVRLTRLARATRVLRFRIFLDLTLMLKGLLGGFRTLGWAMVMLVSTIYMVSILWKSTIADSVVLGELFPDDADLLFGSVPKCMFTSFRCFTGDCTDSTGKGLIPRLTRQFGFSFTVPYTLATMLVTFGIFNLIMAIYIEATLTAAKLHEAGDRNTKLKERLQVAHTTKRLVKRICTLHRVFKAEKLEEGDERQIDFVNEFDDIDDINMSLSREEISLMQDDRYVVAALDDLKVARGVDIFDVLDADGNGELQLLEIVSGVLTMRGEPKKSDTIACLLSVRAMQATLHHVRQELCDGLQAVMSNCTRGFLQLAPNAASHKNVTDSVSAPAHVQESILELATCTADVLATKLSL